MDQHPDGRRGGPDDSRDGRAPRRPPPDQDLAHRTESRRALDRWAEPTSPREAAERFHQPGSPGSPGEPQRRRAWDGDEAEFADVAPGHSDYLHRDDSGDDSGGDGTVDRDDPDARDGRADGHGSGGAGRGEPHRPEARGQYPRAVKYAGAVAIAVVAGWAVYGTLGSGGGSGSGVSAPGPATAADTAGADSGATPIDVGDTASASATQTVSPAKATPSRSKPSPSKSPTTSATAPRSSPASSPSSAFTSLRMGSTGAAVSALQQRLRQDGYILQLLGYQDGTFDRPTYNAVKAFQKSHPGTSQADGSGVYGPATDAALRKETG